MIRIYLAEDSPTVVEAFKRLLEGDPEFQLVGVAGDGLQAQKELPLVRPDILVTDLLMPRMDGLALIRWVMDHHPLPILVLSNTARQEGSTLAFECLEAGATEIGPKLRGGPHQEADRQLLHRLLRVVAGVRVVRRRPRPAPAHPASHPLVRMIAVGASTGGPQALLTLLQGLPVDFPVPLIAVQHIAGEFLEGLAHWLAASTPFRARIAQEGEKPAPGVLHLAPSGRHLELSPDGGLHLVSGRAGELNVPSVDHLFHSLARNLGRQACGVLLTGMGRDGAEGLRAMHDAGAWTVAQAETGCLVYGMPKAAVDRGTASAVVELGGLPGHLAALWGRKGHPALLGGEPIPDRHSGREVR